MTQTVAVPSLTRWGLSSDADLLFRTMTTQGAQSAGTLSQGLDLPIWRVTEALEELRVAGAARMTGTTWACAPVGQAVSGLRARRPAVSVDGMRHLPSEQLVRRRMTELMTNDHDLATQVLGRHSRQLLARREAPGTAMKLLAIGPIDVSGLTGSTTTRVLRSPCPSVLAALPAKLLMIDDRVALFPADPQDTGRGWLEVAQPAFLRMLTALFDHLWKVAGRPAPDAPSASLTDRERALITLLARRHTDASAAATLRISVRSVTNLVRRLMDRYGVENRFQLGLALGAALKSGPPAPRPESPTANS
ncbi:helix-turn-helix domain-containing protein [Paractinoplanes ovalisporus]|nr:helix-turn-helix transcriptional regulator [Actinoplanes ovalisporus]